MVDFFNGTLTTGKLIEIKDYHFTPVGVPTERNYNGGVLYQRWSKTTINRRVNPSVPVPLLFAQVLTVKKSRW